MPSVAGLDERLTRKFLLEHIQSANWQSPGVTDSTSPDLRFDSNQGFWHSMIRIQLAALNWVELKHFQIVDWFPRTPGLYHTHEAQEQRRMAERYVSEENGILFYEPHGKGHMINGGIGSVRFKPIMIQGEDCWLSTATSDGICHSGVPLAIPNYLMKNIDLTKNNFYNILGQVKFLPEFLEHHFHHLSRIPQIYVLVDKVEGISSSSGSRLSVEITPIVFFEGGHRMSLESRENVTYVRCSANSLEELDQAANWLQWYSNRYDGEIITNFDQQRPLFADVPFSLQNIMGGRVDRNRLRRYHIEHADIICEKVEQIHAEVATMSTIKVDFGNGNIFHGDVVVAEKIKNSFNKADKASLPDDLKDLLKQLAVAVGKMSEALSKDEAEQVARDLETLTTEATSVKPRRQWWELSLEGLKKAAKNVEEIGAPVIRLASEIAAILAGM
jgi:hypothetical protein